MDNIQHKKIGILGGSFNPVHIGHIRLAIEIYEKFYPSLEYIDLVPCANPPHKNVNSMLPFDLRVELLKNAITNIDYLKINTNEYLRQGPSFTYDTLLEYNTRFSCQELFFILGEKDFLTIQSWNRGLDLVELTNIVVVSQAKHNVIDFKSNVLRLWAHAKCDLKNDIATFSLEDTKIFYIDSPHLDINSSLIRERWIKGKSTKYLIPDSTADLLNIHRKVAEQYWIDI